MAPASIHQAIHGYRDGHRLLSSSTRLGPSVARAMLVLSDMSGPSMHPGFEEYVTGYPLSGTDFFVFAKTWYAPEMQRPGCVWTHSLLIPREVLPHVTTKGLLGRLRRPQVESVEHEAATPLAQEEAASEPGSRDFSREDGLGERTGAAAVVAAVLGQPRPVIVPVDVASRLEAVILGLWDELWPAARARFSFCTGALMPRSNAGELLDLQAVPRAIPPSQFRKSASASLVLSLAPPSKPEGWVELVLNGATGGGAAFRSWLEATAGTDAGRSVVPVLWPIFVEWEAPMWSAAATLTNVLNAAEDLNARVVGRLVAMVFSRVDAEAGTARRRELLQDACGHRGTDPALAASMLEGETRKLFEDSRAEGVALVLSLLGTELTEVGERVLRDAVRLVVPSDLENLGDAHTPFLATIVGANPTLASSPGLWKRVGGRSAEVLAQLSTEGLNDEGRESVVDAILSSGSDVLVDALIRFGGKAAILRGLTALTVGKIPLSWPWRAALAAHPDAVLEWLEHQSNLALRDLELGSRFLSPKTEQARLATVWERGMTGTGSPTPRVAAFGLALALWDGASPSCMLALCFQPTFDAAGSSRLEYEEWDWLRELAPPVSWYRDWDHCERLAAAAARLLATRAAPLATVFGVVYSRAAMRKVAAVLSGDHETRPYLKSLRDAAQASPSMGTPEQRDALLAGWW